MNEVEYYVLVLEGGIRPVCAGPYETEKERDDEARRLRRDADDGEDAVCWATITRGADGVPVLSTGSYCGAFFQDVPSPEDGMRPSSPGCTFAAD